MAQRPHSDLFDAAAAEELSRTAPLATRMRPTTLEEFVGQTHLVGAGATLRALIEADRLSSAVFFGPAGLGQDDARPHRGGCLGQGLRPALGDRRPG